MHKTFLLTVAMALLSLGAFADRTATQQWVTNTISKTVPAIATNTVRGMSAAYDDSRRYALFIIPMNPRSSSAVAAGFRDFELKATTNNFVTEPLFYTASAWNRTTYYSGSYTNDWCRLYVTSKEVSSDVRKWQEVTNGTILGTYAPKEYAVIIDTTLFKSGHGTEWCRECNEELIWSFTRFDSEGAEVEYSGETGADSRICWHPIMPVKWYSRLPNWANQIQ